MEEDLCRGVVYLTVLCGHIPTLFPCFLVFRYPYILLHFKCFLLLYTVYTLVTVAHYWNYIDPQQGAASL